MGAGDALGVMGFLSYLWLGAVTLAAAVVVARRPRSKWNTRLLWVLTAVLVTMFLVIPIVVAILLFAVIARAL